MNKIDDKVKLRREHNHNELTGVLKRQYKIYREFMKPNQALYFALRDTGQEEQAKKYLKYLVEGEEK